MTSSTYENYMTILENSKLLENSQDQFNNIILQLQSYIDLNQFDKVNEIIKLMSELKVEYKHIYSIYIKATTDTSYMYGWQRNQSYNERKQSKYIFECIKKNIILLKVYCLIMIKLKCIIL